LLKPRLMLKPRSSERQPKLLQELLQPLLRRNKTGLIKQREMLRLLQKNWLMNKLLYLLEERRKDLLLKPKRDKLKTK